MWMSLWIDLVLTEIVKILDSRKEMKSTVPFNY